MAKSTKSKFNTPWTTVAVLAIDLVGILVLVLTGNGDNATVAILIAALPGLVGAGYAERNSRDIHNGVVTQKVKEGATQALVETGVTAVADAAAGNTTAAMEALHASTQALTELLKLNIVATQTNTDATQTNTQLKGGSQNGGQTV